MTHVPDSQDGLEPSNELSEDMVKQFEQVEDVEIEGIDPGKASTAWSKLKGCSRYEYDILKHPQHFFEFQKGGENSATEGITRDPHYVIGVHPPNGDPRTSHSVSVADFLLIRTRKGTFRVVQSVYNEAVPLTANEVNSLLEQIASSTLETDDESDKPEDVIRQTRSDLQQ